MSRAAHFVSILMALLFSSSTPAQSQAEVAKAIAASAHPRVVAAYQLRCLADGTYAPQIDYDLSVQGIVGMLAAAGVASLSTPPAASTACGSLDRERRTLFDDWSSAVVE